jgi:hypothetical protein
VADRANDDIRQGGIVCPAPQRAVDLWLCVVARMTLQGDDDFSQLTKKRVVFTVSRQLDERQDILIA